MEGVRRNIALKLKPSLPKEGGPHHSRGEAGKKKEKGSDEAPPTSPDVINEPSQDTTQSVESFPSSPPPPPVTIATSSVSGKVPPDSIVESGGSLRWDQKVNLLGRAVQDPLLHICEVCSLPVLIYGRMKRCRHAFCRDCAKKSGGVCPRCKETDQLFEEASMGNVYICTHSGGRYDNTGCGRSYLSQRDLEAHITYRHKDKTSLQPPNPVSSQSAGLPSLPIPPPFFPMVLTPPPPLISPSSPSSPPPQPAGLPPNFPLQTLPPHIPNFNRPGSRGQPLFPAQLQQVFVSQHGTSSTNPTVPTVPPTWTTATLFKPPI